MQVFRYMSKEEFFLYMKGEILHNDKDHSIRSKTDSKGFCFMDTKDWAPEDAWDFLVGIVSEDVCVVFNVDKRRLKKSKGLYADPYGSWDDTIWVPEYCCQSYNNKDFKLIKYSTEFDWGLMKWKTA